MKKNMGQSLVLEIDYLHPLENGESRHSFIIGLPYDMPRPTHPPLKNYEMELEERTPNSFNIYIGSEIVRYLFCTINLDGSLNRNTIQQLVRLPETTLIETMNLLHHAHSLVLDHNQEKGYWLQPSN